MKTQSVESSYLLTHMSEKVIVEMVLSTAVVSHGLHQRPIFSQQK